MLDSYFTIWYFVYFHPNQSGALVMYLADKAGALKTPEERAVAAQWTLFANATLLPAMMQRGPGLNEMLSVLDGLLASKPFLAGEECTASDVAGKKRGSVIVSNTPSRVMHSQFPFSS